MQADISTEVKAKMMEAIMKCKEKEGASMDQLKQLQTEDSPPTPAKCVAACMQETNGALKDGKFDSEFALQQLKTFFKPTDDEFEKMKQIHAECDSTGNGAERCEGAFQRMKCSRDAAKRLGLAFPGFD